MSRCQGCLLGPENVWDLGSSWPVLSCQSGGILTWKGAFKANFLSLMFPALERTVDYRIPLGQQQSGKFGSTFLLLQPKDWVRAGFS